MAVNVRFVSIIQNMKNPVKSRLIIQVKIRKLSLLKLFKGGYCTARLEVEEAPENPEIPTMTADDMVLNFVTPMNLEANKDGIRIYCIISNLTEDIIVEWGREPPFDELPLKAPKYKAETK